MQLTNLTPPMTDTLDALLRHARDHAAEVLGAGPIDVIIRLRGTCQAVKYSLDCRAADRTVSANGVSAPIRSEPQGIPIVTPERLGVTLPDTSQSLRERILSILSSIPHKATWYARKLEVPCGSYFRRVWAQIVRDGLVERHADGGWVRT